MSKFPINHKAWAENAVGFIRERGLEREFSDWCGGWPCPVRSTGVADITTPLTKALEAASGYLLNAKIDLETGAPKRTAINTIDGGLKVVRAALDEVQEAKP